MIRDRQHEALRCGVEQGQTEQRRPGEVESGTAVVVE